MLRLACLRGGATTSRQYVDYGRRAWGPQEEELGEKEMNPFLFNRKVRQT